MRDSKLARLDLRMALLDRGMRQVNAIHCIISNPVWAREISHEQQLLLRQAVAEATRIFLDEVERLAIAEKPITRQ